MLRVISQISFLKYLDLSHKKDRTCKNVQKVQSGRGRVCPIRESVKGAMVPTRVGGV